MKRVIFILFAMIVYITSMAQERVSINKVDNNDNVVQTETTMSSVKSNIDTDGLNNSLSTSTTVEKKQPKKKKRNWFQKLVDKSCENADRVQKLGESDGTFFDPYVRYHNTHAPIHVYTHSHRHR